MKQIQIDFGDFQLIINKDQTVDKEGYILIGLANTPFGKQVHTFKEFWLHPLLAPGRYLVLEDKDAERYTPGRKVVKTKVLGVGRKANK